MALLLITHDLGVVAEMADSVVVMYGGKVVEAAGVATLFARPRHPYTEGLFRSLPSQGRRGDRLQAIAGSVPSAVHFPSGCRFRDRCPVAEEVCAEREPPLVDVGDGHLVACPVEAPGGSR